MSRVLAEAEWTARARAHAERAETVLAPLQRHRTDRGQPHPVWDFLFTYYNLRPRHLRTWHPGYGVALAGDGALGYLRRSGYHRGPGGVTVSPDRLRARRPTIEFVHGLLAATAARPAQLNCFGLHEWAMVYRSPELRHAQLPLRLGAAGSDAVVEAMSLRCTHFDAFRFFTPAAVPRNATPLSRAGQIDREQPGCIHASMDLYKWAFKLSPLIDSGLVLDAFQLACAARELDMRASPYELRDLGFEPICIETPAGRADYVRHQADITARAGLLRQALRHRCRTMLTQPASVSAS